MTLSLTAENEALKAHVNSLREALTKVAFMGTDNAMGTDREYFMSRQLYNCIGIASEALATYQAKKE